MTVFGRFPVDNPRITQRFGSPNDWESPPWHKALDLGGNLGEPIYAPCDAFVVWASGAPFGYGNTWEQIAGSGNAGNCIILQPPAPHTALQTSLCHLSEILVTPGQWVTEGQLIGRMGSTGFSFGVHLHWEVFIDYAEGAYPEGTFYGRVDPLEYFKTVNTVPITTGGKGSTTPAIEPEEEEDDMALSPEDRKLLQAMHDVTRQFIVDNTQKQHDVTRTHLINMTQKQHDVTRAYLADSTQAQEDVTRKFLSERIAEGGTPADIADSVVAALGVDQASKVVQELVHRLPVVGKAA